MEKVHSKQNWTVHECGSMSRSPWMVWTMYLQQTLIIPHCVIYLIDVVYVSCITPLPITLGVLPVVLRLWIVTSCNY